MSKLLVPRSAITDIINNTYDDGMKRAQQFWKSFKLRRAKYPIPNLDGKIHQLVFFNESNQTLDVSNLSALINPVDRDLYKDLIKYIGEEFIGKPASTASLLTFKQVLALRMNLLGF